MSSNDSSKVEILTAYNKAWNDHDVDALMSYMTDDCVFHTVAGPDVYGTTHRGRDDVRKAFESAWLNVADAQWKDGSHFASGDYGVSECTFAGTAEDGSRIEARMVDVFTFKDGKIAVKNAFRKNRPPQPAT